MNRVLLRELALVPDALTLFPRLKHLTGSFLLHSGSGFSGQRYDLFSALPSEQVLMPCGLSHDDMGRVTQTMVNPLNHHPVSTPPSCPLPGWYGVAAYDMVGGHSASSQHSGQGLQAGFYPVVFFVDRRERKLFCASLAEYESLAQHLIGQLDAAPTDQASFSLKHRFASNMSLDQYRACFERVQAYLHTGDCYQVNLAQRFAAAYTGDPWLAYRHLIQALPAPMGCYFNLGDSQVLSLSPERFIAIRQGVVTTHPIKGTRPRYPQDPQRDQAQIEDLRNSEKDRAENLMIVDLLRNDLGISCEPGSIRVTELFGIHSFANVHHMVSDIEGRLRANIHPLEALFAAFPGGSITGAPKKRAMEIIAELEPDSRSFYCGSAFYCNVGGRLDSSILIRTLVCHGDSIFCWGGGGIVADSTAQAEYQETLDKVGLILRELEQVSGLG